MENRKKKFGPEVCKIELLLLYALSIESIRLLFSVLESGDGSSSSVINIRE